MEKEPYLFDDVWLSNESKEKTLKRWGTIFLSFGLHFMAVFWILYGPLVGTVSDFPELKIVDIYVSVVPKPPPTMRAAKRRTQKKTRVVKKNIKKKIKKEEISPSALIVPIEIPGKIVDEEEDYPVSDIAFGEGGGVEGGIEGGYEGGVIGGSLMGEFVEEEIDPVRVQKGDIVLLNEVIPDYPQEALEKRIRGEVIIEIVTGAFGNVKKCKVIHGPPILKEAAREAVMKWRYKPYLVRGKPTPIIVTIVVEFKKANF